MEGFRAYQRGDVKAAVEAYRQALSASPRDASLWYDLGCLYAINRQPDEAREALLRAMSLNPRLADAHDALGQLYEQEGRVDVAQAFYVSADTVAPGRPKILRHVIRAFAQLGQLEPARLALRELLLAAPDDLEARYQLGVLELRADAPESAIQEFQVILERVPRHVMAFNGLALAYARIGAFTQAERALEDARRIDPNDVMTQTNAGVIAAYQRHWDDARAAWQHALERQPHFEPASKNLEALNALSPSADP
jgi:tetratricopeptide (TPR) repeat protein